MHRIDTATAQKDKFGAGKNGFTDGDPQTGIQATDLEASYFDSIQEEISGVIESEGVALDVTNNGQLNAAIDNKIANATGAIPAAPVTSVNGKTGDVKLTAPDVGALPDTYQPPVTSVNTKTGAVALTAADVGALPDTYTPPGVDLSPYETIADADAKFMRDTQLVGYTVISAEGDNRAPAGCVFVMIGDFGSGDGYGGYSAIQKQINGTWYTVGSV